MEQSEVEKPEVPVSLPLHELDDQIPGKLLENYEAIRTLDPQTQIRLAHSCSQLVYSTKHKAHSSAAATSVSQKTTRPISARRRQACKPSSVRSVRSQQRRTHSRQRSYPADVRPKKNSVVAGNARDGQAMPSSSTYVAPRRPRPLKFVQPTKTTNNAPSPAVDGVKRHKSVMGLHKISNAVAGYIRPRSPTSAAASASTSPPQRGPVSPVADRSPRTGLGRRLSHSPQTNSEPRRLSTVGKVMAHYVKPPQAEEPEAVSPVTPPVATFSERAKERGVKHKKGIEKVVRQKESTEKVEKPQKEKLDKPAQEHAHRPLAKLLSNYVKPPTDDSSVSPTTTSSSMPACRPPPGKSLYTLPSEIPSSNSFAPVGLVKTSAAGVPIAPASIKSSKRRSSRQAQKQTAKLYTTNCPRGRTLPRSIVAGNGVYKPPTVVASGNDEVVVKQAKPLLLHLSRFLKRGKSTEYNAL